MKQCKKCKAKVSNIQLNRAEDKGNWNQGEHFDCGCTDDSEGMCSCDFNEVSL